LASPTTSAPQTDKTFGRALQELIRDREEFSTQTGNVNWRAVARALPGVHYETLRKAAASERDASIPLIETVAAMVGVEPTYFLEYRLWAAARDFDASVVGEEVARNNLKRWRGVQRSS